MKEQKIIILATVFTFNAALIKSQNVRHIWEKVEIILKAEGEYKNPYTEVDVWVELSGPDKFHKKCFGFWDGNNIFRIRILATHPGEWKWKSSSNQNDRGLKGKSGNFTAIDWSEEEKLENPNKRGMIKLTENGHALEYHDGTPYFLLADQWWATPTFRFKWYEDNKERPMGSEAGFKDYVRFRKKQEYNCIAILAAFPAWANDKYPRRMDIGEGLTLRNAWKEVGTDDRAKDMHNEGGRPFLFPGKVPGYEDYFPDMDRINPAYFQHLDKKVDYLNENGFIPFIEIARRDVSTLWKKFYDFEVSYARYIQYLFSRYQANICIMSPIHFDSYTTSVPPDDYKKAIELARDKMGSPPFGTLISTNPQMSSLVNFGNQEWIDIHQTGNLRAHKFYWYLTEIFYEVDPPKPALNGEPYCAGNFSANELLKYAFYGTFVDDRYVRSGMYGSFLSGGLAGHMYTAEGIWSADIEEGSEPYLWEAIQWNSGKQMQYFKHFVLSEGDEYQNLCPDNNFVFPDKLINPTDFRNEHDDGAFPAVHEGWSYCARTKDRKLFMVYFEKGSIASLIRGAVAHAKYEAKWYNPRNGEWRLAGDNGILTATKYETIILPKFPSDDDWALKLKLIDENH
ncbi:DUF4038 domain-containing protein [Bacteroidota bacterium]